MEDKTKIYFTNSLRIAQMKTNIILALLIIGLTVLSGCSGFMTREETDIYAVTERDTTVTVQEQNLPGNRDNGVIYPSSRVFQTKRTVCYRYFGQTAGVFNQVPAQPAFA